MLPNMFLDILLVEYTAIFVYCFQQYLPYFFIWGEDMGFPSEGSWDLQIQGPRRCVLFADMIMLKLPKLKSFNEQISLKMSGSVDRNMNKKHSARSMRCLIGFEQNFGYSSSSAPMTSNHYSFIYMNIHIFRALCKQLLVNVQKTHYWVMHSRQPAKHQRQTVPLFCSII